MPRVSQDVAKEILEGYTKRDEEKTINRWKRLLREKGDEAKAIIKAESGLKKAESTKLIKELEEEIRQEDQEQI